MITSSRLCKSLFGILQGNEYSDHPIITDEEIEKYDIDIRQIFNDHSIAYCG